jgi:hypothetical protein
VTWVILFVREMAGRPEGALSASVSKLRFLAPAKGGGEVSAKRTEREPS